MDSPHWWTNGGWDWIELIEEAAQDAPDLDHEKALLDLARRLKEEWGDSNPPTEGEA